VSPTHVTRVRRNKRSYRQKKKLEISDEETRKIIPKRCQKIQAQFQY
jgi:hypothetical protein